VQRLEVSGAVRPIYGSLGVKRVYLWYNVVRFLAVCRGWTEAIFAQQNKSEMRLCPPRRKSTKGFM